MCNSLNRKASEVAVAYLQWSKVLIKIRLMIIYKSRVVMKIIMNNNFMTYSVYVIWRYAHTRITLQWLQWNIVVYMTVYKKYALKNWIKLPK